PRLRVTQIKNGVDLVTFRAADRSREPDAIVFTGKMSYHANATAARFFAREVFPVVRSVRPSAKLYIVGSDPPPDLRSLGKEPGIEVTGYVANIAPYLGRAAVAVAPMVVKVGTQLKILEAMAAGMPVVSTPAGTEGLAAEAGRDLLVGATPHELA